jgi:hypothetical protein
MRTLVAGLACAIGLAAAGGVILADNPPPTEEEIEAKLKEARKKVEAAEAETRALAKQLEETRQQPRGHIKAEVAGVLCRGDGGEGYGHVGYYVRVRTERNPKHEVRVALVVPENKVLVRELDEAMGKDIVVAGSLTQDAKGGLVLNGVEVKPQPPQK